jgi:hypothetical protein
MKNRLLCLGQLPREQQAAELYSFLVESRTYTPLTPQQEESLLTRFLDRWGGIRISELPLNHYRHHDVACWLRQVTEPIRGRPV